MKVLVYLNDRSGLGALDTGTARRLEELAWQVQRGELSNPNVLVDQVNALPGIVARACIRVSAVQLRSLHPITRGDVILSTQATDNLLLDLEALADSPGSMMRYHLGQPGHEVLAHIGPYGLAKTFWLLKASYWQEGIGPR